MTLDFTLETKTEVRAFVAIHYLASRGAFTPPYLDNHSWVAFHDSYGQDIITEEEENAFRKVCHLSKASYIDCKGKLYDRMHELAGACFNVEYDIDDLDEWRDHAREVVNAMLEHQLQRFNIK